MESVETKVINFILLMFLYNSSNIFTMQENEIIQEKAHTVTRTKTKVKFDLQKPNRRHFYGDIDESSGHRKRSRFHVDREHHVGWVLDSRAHPRPRTTSFG